MRARRYLAAATVALLGWSATGCGKESVARPSMDRGLIILGVDGMDPDLLRQYIGLGLVPNLAKLAERGSLGALGTSNPPQSPVAWSTFTTGLDPGGHGIYDFVHRDLTHMAPMLSTSSAESAPPLFCLGSHPISLDSSEIKLLREGKPFWEYLSDAGIPSTMTMVAANFPPPGARLAEVMSGMGTPDVLGTPGTYQVFSDNTDLLAKIHDDPERVRRVIEEPELVHALMRDIDPSLEEEDEGYDPYVNQPLEAGIVHPLDFAGGQTVSTVLSGPPYDQCKPGKVLTAPVTITVDRKRPAALLNVDGREVLLAEGEWSDWVPVAYPTGMLGGAVPGIVRFYLRSVRPEFHLYASPVNIDPLSPALPISTPESYAQEIAEELGRFYTQEMKPDTKALKTGALGEEEFLSQVDIVFRERMALLRRELDRFQGGLLFFYISSVDQLSHVYFRSLAEDASEHDRQYKHVIPTIYSRADAALGQVLETAGDKYDVIVMSDHGFSHYRKQVNINTWLVERGYLSVLPPDKKEPGELGHIDWANTQAYGMGLNGLFLNVEGREPNGTVPADEVEPLMRRLERDLLNMIDPEDNQQVVSAVVRPPVGEFRHVAPDLLVGYNRGYRSGDLGAIGQLTSTVLRKNDEVWSGDHCMDPDLVPGVVLSTRPVTLDDPSLANFAATVLDYFDVAVPAGVEGASLWQKTK